MLVCSICAKGVRKQNYSRHKKGSSGGGGTWALRAPIHSKTQRPNLHTFKGRKYCTKCLRVVRSIIVTKLKKVEVVAVENRGSLLKTLPS